jgi:DNA topoisomerase-1
MSPRKQPDGKPLVIVESPAKARTIARYLGADYAIEASIGHVRDLPASADQIPPEAKQHKWARLGIDVEHDFKPLYIVPEDKRPQIKKLKKLVQHAPVVYLATDEDREGESISWHLVQVLEPEGEVRRLVFHEITKSAIQNALQNPRDIDQNLVEAQETRRLVDRLFGYEVSPLLWKKIKPRLSAGRVQSVAVRLVVERERERIRFRAASFWDLKGQFEPKGGAAFDAALISVGGRRVATGKDFDPSTGRLSEAASDRLHLDEAAARALVARLQGKPASVESVEQKPYTERPQPPFTTSTLQQEAGRKLGFAAKRAMRAAQRLYEGGHITYMRTDSTELSSEALDAARNLIRTTYGAEHLPSEPRAYRTKVRNAQEAHEAIRPAGSSFTHPDQLGGEMGSDEQRVYELIWKRTVACQMKDAHGQRTTLVLALGDARFQATGRTVEYPGFRLAYVERGEDGEGAESEADRILPKVARGDALAVRELEAEGHSTRPPARLTEASLVAELEARGIGRPSTYASIIDTILQRDYCFKKGSALVPTLTAFAVLQVLDGPQLDWLVDYTFTARMEDDLDEISNGRKARLDYLRSFYVGNGRPGLRERLSAAEKSIDPRSVCTIQDFELGEYEGSPIEVRVGRYGPFLACGDLSATLPDSLAPDELDAAKAHELLGQAAAGPRVLGKDAGGLSVMVKTGRFGPYFQLGTLEELGEKKKPKMVSLLARMSPDSATLEDALAMLALPRELGELTLPEGEPGAGETHRVLAHLGRFGPFLKCGPATRSIPSGEDVLSIGLDRARELFAEPKRGGRGARSAPTVLKELGAHPVSGAALRVLDGRYGPYITDGNVNATLPKDQPAAEVTLQRAVELIDAKASQQPRKGARRGARKSPAATDGAKKPAKVARTAAQGRATPAATSRARKSDGSGKS